MKNKRAQEEVVEEEGVEEITWEPWQDEMHAATQVVEDIEEKLRNHIDTLRLTVSFADQFVDENDMEFSDRQGYMVDETVVVLDDLINQLNQIVENMPHVIATLEDAAGL